MRIWVFTHNKTINTDDIIIVLGNRFDSSMEKEFIVCYSRCKPLRIYQIDFMAVEIINDSAR